MAVIDPPFITQCVWEKYASISKLLLASKPRRFSDTSKENADDMSISTGMILATTVVENKEMMDRLLDCRPTNFRPSIPNLVYQYNTYSNFPCERLAQANPEIDRD
uniref:Uncharacterized protein n=1 Tax=Proboscia inermis TaxID=420281 RepID=A0A7S0BZS1_9STRA|mmetsp:Transcript_18658/g.18892  ORF Transcript_18658/g.18892 Transcript_18658/m.18892 type:complete len:106 (+) Transcript_18658:270-587(+)